MSPSRILSRILSCFAHLVVHAGWLSIRESFGDGHHFEIEANLMFFEGGHNLMFFEGGHRSEKMHFGLQKKT